MSATPWLCRAKLEAYKNQSGIEILVVLPHVLSIVLCCLPFVHGEEVEVRVFIFNRLEILPEGLLNAVRRQSLRFVSWILHFWNVPLRVDLDWSLILPSAHRNALRMRWRW